MLISVHTCIYSYRPTSFQPTSIMNMRWPNNLNLLFFLAISDELLDISKALDGVESSFVRSFDSGIEVDEDLCSVKSSDCSANEYPLRCHLAKYEGYTYVVAETLSHDLERFHRSGRQQASAGGGAAAATTPSATYKCGFCIFECSVRQELNKHLQIHLGELLAHSFASIYINECIHFNNICFCVFARGVLF